jgi:hypothetical protein
VPFKEEIQVYTLSFQD